jgi:hypothetical protein
VACCGSKLVTPVRARFQAWYHVVCYRLDHDGENDRDVCDRFFGRPNRHGTRHDKDVHLETDQVGKKFGIPLILPFRESRLDDDVLAIDVA